MGRVFDVAGFEGDDYAFSFVHFIFYMFTTHPNGNVGWIYKSRDWHRVLG